jgi:hypothetical protein
MTAIRLAVLPAPRVCRGNSQPTRVHPGLTEPDWNKDGTGVAPQGRCFFKEEGNCLLATSQRAASELFVREALSSLSIIYCFN